jgi:hypothetical protein
MEVQAAFIHHCNWDFRNVDIFFDRTPRRYIHVRLKVHDQNWILLRICSFVALGAVCENVSSTIAASKLRHLPRFQLDMGTNKGAPDSGLHTLPVQMTTYEHYSFVFERNNLLRFHRSSGD